MCLATRKKDRCGSNGCRRKEFSKIRKEFAMRLVFELGLSYTETAPLLGVLASEVCQIIKTTTVAGIL